MSDLSVALVFSVAIVHGSITSGLGNDSRRFAAFRIRSEIVVQFDHGKVAMLPTLLPLTSFT